MTCNKYWKNKLFLHKFVCLHNQVFFCMPLLLVPWGFQSSASLSVAPHGLHSVWSIQRHFLSVICWSVDICFVLWHMTFKYVVEIFLQALGVNYLSVSFFFHVPHLYKMPDLTFVLKNRIIVLSKICRCPRRNVPDFGRMFLMLKYTHITQNTYIQSWTVTEIMAQEKCGFLAVPRTVPVQLMRNLYTAHVHP